MIKFRIIASDFFVSFVWVWSGSLLRLLADRVLGSGTHLVTLALKALLAVLYLYFFALLRKATKGGSYNPLLVLCHAISGDFMEFMFAIFARIPAQGALTEGVLTFMIVTVSLGLKKIHPRSYAMKTWMSSISKVIFHLLGSDITGGIMNPATAFGLAYAKGGHLTKEHWCVYWLAPMEGTLLGVWACSLFPQPNKRNIGWQLRRQRQSKH